MIKRRGFLGGLIAAAFSPAIASKPAAASLEPGMALWGPKTIMTEDATSVFAWKPVLRRVVPGLVEAPAGFLVQPMYKHIASLPIMATLSDPSFPSSNAPHVPSAHPAPEPFDWNFELVSWRDENGNLTNPPEGYER